MNIITMSKRKLESLEPLVLKKGIMNTEAQILELKDNRGNDKILKKLYNDGGSIFANKLYTIEMLNTYQEYLPSNFVIPDSLVSVNKKIVAFTIPKAKGENLSVILNSKEIAIEEQIYYLKKIGEILEQLKNIRKYTPLKDLHISDLHESNFIANPSNKHLSIIDLDSCKIAGNRPFASRYLTPFSLLKDTLPKYQLNKDEDLPAYIIANEQSDLYCYCSVILNYLYGSNINNLSIEEFYQYMNYLNDIGISKELIDDLEKIVSYHNNENPLYSLDTLTKEQVVRAKEHVYKLVKTKRKGSN